MCNLHVLMLMHVCVPMYMCVCARSLTVGRLREKQSRLLSAIEGLEAARQERNEEIAALKVTVLHRVFA